MDKTDKRLTINHLTAEENEKRLKEIGNLTDVAEKAEEEIIEFERAGLLERINTRKAINHENKVDKNASQPV